MAVRKFNQYKLTGTIGSTNVLLSRYGCLICSICSVHSRFWKNTVHPQEAAKAWDFTPDALLYWSSNFEGMKFEKRVDRAPTKDECVYWIRSRERGMVLELNNGAHWVMAWYYPFSIGVNGCMVVDSLGAKTYLLGLSNHKCTGFATFSKGD